MKPLVSIWMIAYNQEKFIAQALESALMQITNFAFEIVISEDCSTDGTRDIIKKYEEMYPTIVCATYLKKNVGAVRNAFEFSWPRCKGKYCAVLEGDDYWSDPFKLQKQVDFLEENQEYGMIHSRVNVVNSDNRLLFISDSNKPSGDVFFNLLQSSFIVTCSACFRNSIVEEIVSHAFKNNLKCMFDYWLWLHIAMRSKIQFITDITSTYRSHSGGITQSTNYFFNEIIPLAVLDAVSYKLKYFPEDELNKKWELYINYCRALTASTLSWDDRIKYLKFIFRRPMSVFAFLPAVWRKIKLRFFVRRK
jgi:glycosyltransferase involved in cell wall biosynthesis